MKHLCSKMSWFLALCVTSCVSIDEPVPELSPFAIVHIDERLEVEGVALGANVIVDVVRRIDGVKQPGSVLESLTPEILSVNLVGSELAIRGLQIGTAVLKIGEQTFTVIVNKPARVELLWPGSTQGKMQDRYIWTDGPEALVVLRDDQERRLWGLTQEVKVDFELTLGFWEVDKQRLIFNNLTDRTANNRELSVKVGELQSETLYFTINENAKVAELDAVEDGNGVWMVGKTADGKLLIPTEWEALELESDCARLVERDPTDLMKDYYSGDLPAHPGVIRLQRKRPGRALGDCEVLLKATALEGGPSLEFKGTIKL